METRICTKCLANHARPKGATCTQCYNAYMNRYMISRYAARRAIAINILGGKCADCELIDNLQIDHIDRSQKSFNISSILVSAPMQRVLLELEKCQLLCEVCHIRKTASEKSVDHGGGLTGKKNCYCEKCKPLKHAYVRRRKQ